MFVLPRQLVMRLAADDSVIAPHQAICTHQMASHKALQRLSSNLWFTCFVYFKMPGYYPTNSHVDVTVELMYLD
jgi:hypothetical protein